MRRARFVRSLYASCTLWAALAAGAQTAAPLVLVTEAEAAREAAAAGGAFTPRALPRPDAPVIRVLAPSLGGEALASPLRIEIAFTARPDAEIDPASFRVQYGVLRIDLTERIAGRVAVDKTGLRVDDVVIPAGRHRLLLRVADTKARTGETELVFSVR